MKGKIRNNFNLYYLYRKLFRFPHYTNLRKMEIDLTTKCSLSCNNCDRNISQAPSNEDVSKEQIKKLIHELLKLEWELEKIGLLGGEPTLHENIFEIFEIIYEYKKRYPNCKIVLFTNGYGNRIKKIINQIPSWIVVNNSQKTSNVNSFFTYNIAPCDLRKFKNADFSKGCNITQGTGFALNKYGFYPCGAGGGVDRVFGFNIGIKRLIDVNEENMRDLRRQLCKYCGHFKPKLLDVRNKKLLVEEQSTSKSWHKAFEDYKNNKPILTSY